jgi:hypothetical protein
MKVYSMAELKSKGYRITHHENENKYWLTRSAGKGRKEQKIISSSNALDFETMAFSLNRKWDIIQILNYTVKADNLHLQAKELRKVYGFK